MDSQFDILYFIHFVVPVGISSMGNSGLFPQGKPAATESRYSTLINDKVHAGSFSIIHQTLTIHGLQDHSYACVYTPGGWAHRHSTESQHIIFDSEKHTFFLVLLTQTGFEPWVFGYRVLCSTN